MLQSQHQNFTPESSIKTYHSQKQQGYKISRRSTKYVAFYEGYYKMLLKNNRGFPQSYKFNKMPIKIPKIVRKNSEMQKYNFEKEQRGRTYSTKYFRFKFITLLSVFYHSNRLMEQKRAQNQTPIYMGLGIQCW